MINIVIADDNKRVRKRVKSCLRINTSAFDTVMSGEKYIQPDISDIVGLQYDMSKNVC